MSCSQKLFTSLTALLVLVLCPAAEALESQSEWIEVPTSVVAEATQQLDSARVKAVQLRSHALGATESLLAEGPAATEAEYDRVLHFVRAGLPGAESAVASERILAATLADHVRYQGTRGRQIDVTGLDFVHLGGTVVVAEPGAEIVVTRSGGMTVQTDALATPETLAGPLVPEFLGFQLGFQGPNVANTSYGGGSCGNSFRSGSRGRVGLCWWKYRMYDESTSNDYWAYLGGVTAEPSSYSWRPDPYVRYARTASQMSSSHRNTLGYVGFTDHNPRVDSSNNCKNVTVGVSIGYKGSSASASVSGVIFCDTWDQYTNGSTSYKRNQFDTGFLGDNGKDIEAAHGSLSHTGQRPWSSYFPSWSDTWWASFCDWTHADCVSY